MLLAAADFSFTADMFSGVTSMINSAAPVVIGIGAPVLGLSLGIGFIFSKIRKVAK